MTKENKPYYLERTLLRPENPVFMNHAPNTKDIRLPLGWRWVYKKNVYILRSKSGSKANWQKLEGLCGCCEVRKCKCMTYE